MDRLPKIGKWVLVYYQTKSYHIIEVGKVRSITTMEGVGEILRGVDWRDMQGNALDPSHWMTLPLPPRQLKQKTDDK
jgi:hypothetical protein